MRLQDNSTWAYNHRVVSDTAGAPIDDTFNRLLQLRHFLGYEQRGFVGFERILQTVQASSKPGSRSTEAISHVTLSENSVWRDRLQMHAACPTVISERARPKGLA